MTVLCATYSGSLSLTVSNWCSGMVHSSPTNHELTADEREHLLSVLEARFQANTQRHRDLEWVRISANLKDQPEKLWSLHEMERTGGEPDVVILARGQGEYVFCDCSPESPKGRRSVCYDSEALESRKEHKPKDSAVGMATRMGIEIVTEAQYRQLQEFGEFDLKTSSWVRTPDEIRTPGGALFCDRRYDAVFVYHNGAESYYASRGFRGVLRI